MQVAERLAVGPLAPLRHREFRLLWTGMSTSLVGNGILLVTLAWDVYDLSSVPAAMSAVGVALSLPQVVTLLIGGGVREPVPPGQGGVDPHPGTPAALGAPPTPTPHDSGE